MTIYLSHLAAQPHNVHVLPEQMSRLLHAFNEASFDAIGYFSLRMSNHGLSVSSAMMRHDADYAREQLRHAHTLPDEPLRELASSMEREIELQSAPGHPVN